jgi:hypothetical protein
MGRQSKNLALLNVAYRICSVNNHYRDRRDLSGVVVFDSLKCLKNKCRNKHGLFFR